MAAPVTWAHGTNLPAVLGKPGLLLPTDMRIQKAAGVPDRLVTQEGWLPAPAPPQTCLVTWAGAPVSGLRVNTALAGSSGLSSGAPTAGLQTSDLIISEPACYLRPCGPRCLLLSPPGLSPSAPRLGDTPASWLSSRLCPAGSFGHIPGCRGLLTFPGARAQCLRVLAEKAATPAEKFQA